MRLFSVYLTPFLRIGLSIFGILVIAFVNCIDGFFRRVLDWYLLLIFFCEFVDYFISLWIMNEIISEVRCLDPSEWRILKVIRLSGRIGKETKYVKGVLLYTRPFSTDYKLKARPDVPSIEKCLYGLREEDYPNDRLDEIILNAVKAQFPDSICSTDRILFEDDLEKVDRFKKKASITAEMLFSLNFQGVDLYVNEGELFNEKRLSLNIYTDCPREKILENLSFKASYRVVSEKPLVDVLASVKFE